MQNGRNWIEDQDQYASERIQVVLILNIASENYFRFCETPTKKSYWSDTNKLPMLVWSNEGSFRADIQYRYGRREIKTQTWSTHVFSLNKMVRAFRCKLFSFLTIHSIKCTFAIVFKAYLHKITFYPKRWDCDSREWTYVMGWENTMLLCNCSIFQSGITRYCTLSWVLRTVNDTTVRQESSLLDQGHNWGEIWNRARPLSDDRSEIAREKSKKFPIS